MNVQPGLIHVRTCNKSPHAHGIREGAFGSAGCGGQPARPVSAAQMGHRLRALGLRPTPAHSTALFGLAAEVPAAILARTLGIAIDVAVDWQHLAGGDWTSYAAEVSCGTNTGADR